MKNAISLFVFMLLVLTINAQDYTQTLKGTITDKETDYPLVGISVILLGEDFIGTTTDLDGKFELKNVPVGRQAIELSSIGYKTITISNILINSAKEAVLNLQLEEDMVRLQVAVITASKDRRKPINEMAAISTRSISMEEVTRFSGSMGDVARMAQNYAGVSGAADDRNDIIVRGNSPTGVLWRMEGVDIPAPNHWSTLGSSGGPISMINTNNLRNSDFLSGAFPAEYGNASAAIFDLKLKNGNTSKYEFLGQIGFNGFEAGVEGPLKIGRNASFIANYRYSTLGVFSALGIDFGTGSAVPQYQDATFKINMPTEKWGRFSLWGIGGVSEIELLAEPEGNLFSDGDQNIISGSQTGVVGLSHLYFIDENTSSNLSVAWSATNSETLIEELLTADAEEFEKFYSSTNYTEKIGINWTLNKKLNAKNRLKTGLIYDNYNLYVKDSILLNNNEWFTELDHEGRTSMYRSFVQWQHKFNEKMTLNTGVHVIYFALNDGYAIEPRINLSYEPTRRLTLAMGYGRHSQLQPLPIYFNKDRNASEERNAANLALDMTKSDHFVVSADYLLSPNMRVKLEGYYQILADLAVNPERGAYSSINVGAGFGFENYTGLVNGGSGKNLGVELTVERFLKRGFYTLLTVSIFDSKYKGYDDVERNTYYNSNYVFNVLAGKEIVFNKKNALTLDVKFNYAGGRRYTPIDLEASIAEGRGVYDNTKIYEAQYAPYIRPDFKIGYRRNSKRSTHTFSIDFQNVINKKNEFYRYYNEKREKESIAYQRGLFPNVTYQVLF